MGWWKVPAKYHMMENMKNSCDRIIWKSIVPSSPYDGYFEMIVNIKDYYLYNLLFILKFKNTSFRFLKLII